MSLYDVDQVALEKSLKTIAWSVEKLVEKGKIIEPSEKILERISPAKDLSPAAQVQLVIEAVFENLQLKRQIFIQLDEQAGPETLLASNTSAISITELGAATKRSDRVLGLHFFSPVPMMKAVEVVRGISTSDETFDAGQQFVRDIARSLMGNPQLLILDEPSEGLSPLIVKELKEQILQLQKENLTMLLVEQNADFALAISNRTYILDKGKVRFSGSASELREDKETRKKYLGV